MKLALLLIYVSLSFSKEIPYFNEKRAMQFLHDQCDFGPRHPGSHGHEKMQVFLKDILTPISDTLFIMNEDVPHPYQKKNHEINQLFGTL